MFTVVNGVVKRLQPRAALPFDTAIGRPLAAIGWHSLGGYAVILLSLRSLSVKRMVCRPRLGLAGWAGRTTPADLFKGDYVLIHALNIQVARAPRLIGNKMRDGEGGRNLMKMEMKI